MARSPTSSEGWKAAILVGSLGSIVVAALALLWIAAFQLVGLRAAATSQIAPETPAAPAPTPPPRAPIAAATETAREPSPRPPSPVSALEPVPSAAPIPSSSAAASSSEERTATLKLFSIPPTSALVDDKPVGRTPLDTAVAPGKHVIVFLDPALGRKTLLVTVKAGETRPVAVKFESETQSPY